MRAFRMPLAGLFLISFSQIIHSEGTWSPSTLSETTKQTTQSATTDYHTCLNREISNFKSPGKDSRDTSNLILKKCESQLFPIRRAFAAERVPESITNRYLRQKRNRAARQVLQIMMFSQSQNPQNNLK